MNTYINQNGWVVRLMPEHGTEGYITFCTFPIGNTCRLLHHEFYQQFKPYKNMASVQDLKEDQP